MTLKVIVSGFVNIVVSLHLLHPIVSDSPYLSFISTTFPSSQSSHLSLSTVPHTPFSTAKYPSFVSFFTLYLWSKIPFFPLTFIVLKLFSHGINVQSCSLMKKVIFIICNCVFVIVKVFAQVM